MFAAVCMTVAVMTSALSAEELAWRKLQRGMSVQQVAETIGAPMLRNAARGHEVWIYDAGAHAQFQGGVLTAWTAPKTKATIVSARPSAASRANEGVARRLLR